MPNEIDVKVTGKEDVVEVFGKVGKAAGKAGDDVAAAAKKSGDSLGQSGKETTTFGNRLEGLGDFAGRVSQRMGDVSSSVTAFTEVSNAARERAARLAQATQDISQAQGDMRQAVRDATQALLDQKQATIDGTQSTIDAEQAQGDLDQANIDAATAQQDLTDAIREHGAGSVEARQASHDLEQAHRDAKQAQADLTQATLDGEQATEDGKQAQEDYLQSARDSKQASLDLAQAQRDAKPPTEIQKWATALGDYAPIVTGVAAATDLAVGANTALSGSFVKNAAAQVGSKVATAASTAATGVATAAQWAWNVALSANPIGLVVLAIAALVAAIVWIAVKTTWFQDLWHAIWGAIGDPVKKFFGWVVDYYQFMIGLLVKGITTWKDIVVSYVSFIADKFMWWFNMVTSMPGRIASVFSWLGSHIAGVFKGAFNGVAYAWNSTIGNLRFTVPGWVPGIGGGSISAPKLPYLDTGGDIIRTGAAIVHQGERVLNRNETSAYAAIMQLLSGLTAGSSTTASTGGTVRLEVGLKPGSDNGLLRKLLEMLAFELRTSGYQSFDSLLAGS